jgi:hypothetical protein
VHENMKDMKLEMPPDDTTLTLRDAITRRVQWRRASIHVDPSVTTLASTTASQSHTAPGSIFPKAQSNSPIQDQPCPSPPQNQSTPLLAPDQTRPPTAPKK